ncbi:HYR domain-containing protein [bacterium]|nr:HYR domain-containing protein [bacterium]
MERLPFDRGRSASWRNGIGFGFQRQIGLGRIAALILLASVFHGTADAATLSGYVEESASTATLAGVSVIVKDVPRTVFRKATTDGVGYFYLSDIADGTYDFYVESYLVTPPVQLTVSGQNDITTIVLKALPPPSPYTSPETVLAERNPTLVEDADGDVHIVFEREGSLLHSVRSEGSWADCDIVTTGTARYPTVAYGSALNDSLTTEGLICTWGTSDTTDTQTLNFSLGRFTASGIEWSTSSTLTNDLAADSAPKALVRGGSSPLVVWSQRRIDITDDADAYYKSIDLAGYTFTPRSIYQEPPKKPPKSNERASISVSVEFASGETVPKWVPVLGGKYEFDLNGEANGSTDCEKAHVDGGLTIDISLSDNASAHGSFSAEADWKASEPDCDYVFDSASCTGAIGAKGKVPSPPVPIVVGGAPIGSVVFYGSLAGELKGTVTWSSGFPGWPEGGVYTVTLNPAVGAELDLLKGFIEGSAEVSGSATGSYAPPSTLKMVSVSITVSGELCGFWGWWCKDFTKTWTKNYSRGGNYYYRESADDLIVLMSRRSDGDYSITEDLVTTKNTSYMGTGNVYEGTPVLDDISSDYYSDGPVSIARNSSGDVVVTWAKEDGDYNSTLGSSIIARTLSSSGSWGTVEEIADSDNFNRDVAIVFDSSDVPMAVWAQADGTSVTISDPIDDLITASENSDIVYSRKTGGTWDTPQSIASISGPDTIPALAAGPSGSALAAWVNDNGSGMQSLCAARWSGSSWSSVDTLTTSTLFDPPAVIYADDGPMVVWAQDSDGDADSIDDWKVYSSTWNGSQWSNPTALITPTTRGTVEVASAPRGHRGYSPFYDPSECDKKGPDFTAPGNMEIGPCAPDDPPGCRRVNYTLPAVTDNCDDAPTIAGDPASGSILAFGMHTITLTATDQWDNETIKTFSVEVLAVDLLYFTAIPTAIGEPMDLEWATAAEIDTIGFHIYRGVDTGDSGYLPGTRLTNQIVPSLGSPTEGAIYQYIDPTPVEFDTEIRVYFLEDIDINGVSTFHGPFYSETLTSTDTKVWEWDQYK